MKVEVLTQHMHITTDIRQFYEHIFKNYDYDIDVCVVVFI